MVRVSNRLWWVGIAVALSGALSGGPSVSAAGLPREVNGKHVMWGAGQGYPATDQISANNLIWHGGTVEATPAVYLVYWGPARQNGFYFAQSGFTYTNTTAMNYLNAYFGNVGGSPWAGVQTQYCEGIMAPAFSCTGQVGAVPITNPTGQLKGTWVDPSPVPADILATGLASNLTTDPIEAEASNAAAHFGYDQNATYFILTEP